MGLDIAEPEQTLLVHTYDYCYLHDRMSENFSLQAVDVSLGTRNRGDK